MKNDIQNKPDESFEIVIQPLKNFITCALNLSEKYQHIYYDIFNNYTTIEPKVQVYLSNQDNFKQLQHYIVSGRKHVYSCISKGIPYNES